MTQVIDCTKHADSLDESDSLLKKLYDARKSAINQSNDQSLYEVVQQPYATLNTGYSIPLVGLGTWKAQPGQVYEAVKSALRCGYRHIDCAMYYGNEAEVGRALDEILAEGWLTRADIFLTSKLWNTDHGADRVKPALEKCLRDLRTDYLDAFLIHWPVAGTNRGAIVSPPIVDTWMGMEAAVRAQLVRSIGVSNFGAQKLQAILDKATIRPAISQFEMHPYWRNDALRQWCSSHDMHCTAYSPLGSPDSAALLGRKDEASVPPLLSHPHIESMAKQYTDRTVAACLIRWALDRGTSVLPKSVSPSRIRSNLHDALGWKLAIEHHAALSALSHQRRSVDGSFWVTPAGPYKTLEEFWA